MHTETPGALDRSGNWICGPQFGLQRERDTKISVTIFVKFSRLGQFYTFFEIFKGLDKG